MAPLDPIRMTQVLLFAEQRTYTKFAASVWAAMIESEQFFRAADLVEDCVRVACLPGASPNVRVDLPDVDHAALSSNVARAFWNEMRARYSRTYDQGQIVRAVRKQFLPSTGDKSYIFIATDQEIRPPDNWRYILWDGVDSDTIISIAAMDPQYWGERAAYAARAVKHRFRTALINAIGQTIGMARCENEECLEFDNIDSVARLDAMRLMGKEHGLSRLTNFGFAAETATPEKPQPIVANPSPPKSWGMYV